MFDDTRVAKVEVLGVRVGREGGASRVRSKSGGLRRKERRKGEREGFLIGSARADVESVADCRRGRSSEESESCSTGSQ